MDLAIKKPIDIEIEADPIATGEDSTGTAENVQEQGLDKETRRNQRYDRETIKSLNRQKISETLDFDADTSVDNVNMVQLANANYLRELNKYNVSF